MTEFLVRHFVKDYEAVEKSAVRTAYGVLASMVGIVCNVFLFLVKFIVGLLLHSVSVTADAFNNLSDAASSIISFIGVKMAGKPADKEHPFGHGRIEYIAALIVSFLVLEVGFTFLKDSVSKIRTPETLNFQLISVVILILSIGVKLWLGVFNKKLGKKIDSKVMMAVFTDSMGDVITTSATILSLVIFRLTGLNIDGIVGIGVALVVMWAGVGIAKDTLEPLIGEAIDPEEARRILDEELYGMEKVKQRIIETIIQINRTHTLPAYGLLLVGPAGTGKSQIAYAVARILKLPWTTLDMSSINDPEQLTGSSRIYSNAKPGIIMDAFAMAGESNLVFIINELDKAASGKGNGNPADVLLTLLDNLGFTDNYMECMVPTVGVYPIATANDKEQISAPLMSRFAVIDIPDYSFEEKKVIFSKFSLPKVLKRMSLKEEECIVTDDALDAVIEKYADTTGIRDLEQAAEHIAANALYQIEVEHKGAITYTREMVNELLG